MTVKNEELRKTRFTGIDLSPNHYGMITLDGTGELVAAHYMTNTHKGVRLAGADERFTATYYKHPTKKENPDKQYKDVARLSHVTDDVADQIAAHRSDYVAIEDYAWDAGGSEYQIGEVGGSVKRDLWEMGIPFRLMDNTSIKMFVAGNGNASKEAVMASVEERWSPSLYLFCTGANKRRTEGDLCDAFGLAYMCWVEWKLRHGLMSPTHLEAKELQVYMRTTKSQPVNVLGRDWITKPDDVE